MRCVRGPVLKTPPLQRREREFDHRLGSKGAALAAQIKESACSAGDLGSIPGLGRSPWRREWLPTSVFLPGKVHGQRSLVYYSPWGHKESDITEWLTHWGNKIPHAVWYSQKIKSKKKKIIYQGSLLPRQHPGFLFRGWSCIHHIPGTYQNSKCPEGKQLFSINHIVCLNSLGTVSHFRRLG